MENFAGRKVLVTGGAKGIGFAIARGFASAGADVFIGDIAAADEAAAALRAEGFKAKGQPLDVADEASVAAAISACDGQLDVLVNNAGLFAGLSRGRFADLSLDEWRRAFDVNVGGVFLMSRAAWPLLRASGQGRIISITSATAFSAPPMMLHYVATKGALTAMTKSMAREMGADGITVNAVAPGYTLSDGVINRAAGGEDAQMARARAARAISRDQMPDDLVGATLFFASHAAAFVTGQTLVVDGGAVMP